MAVRPLLNRLVFTGIHVSRMLRKHPRGRIRRPALASPTVAAIATVALDRIAPDLLAAGLERLRRATGRESWKALGGFQLELSHASGDGTTNDEIVRDYAVLLTRSLALAPDLTVRVTVPAIQLALSWVDFCAGAASFTESADVEDILEIVACHADLGAEVAALPDELRTTVAAAAGALAAHESCAWALRRALPDSRLAPGEVARVHDDLWTIAKLGPAKAA